MSMINKQLKELLNQYPDDSTIYIYDNNYIDSHKHITSVEIKYIDSDDYKVPDIVLN